MSAQRRRRRPRGRAAQPPASGPDASQLERLDEFRWQIPTSYKPGMRVPGVIYSSEAMLPTILSDKPLEQLANVTFLPGIVEHALAMPDVHWGYGFPVGGVAATDVRDGVISPGGIGFDINCGVRLIRTNLTEADLRPRLDEVLDSLFRAVPAGMGTKGRIRLTHKTMDRVLRRGAAWAVDQGYGWPEDLEVAEESGTMPGADPSAVSARAKERGAGQLGTLGSGNHFLELQAVDEVFDASAAEALGVGSPGAVVIYLHTGSRGCGHQICQDYLQTFAQAPASRAIELPDRQLACAPLRSPEGQAYLAAMACGANFAWANRQAITHWTREALAGVFGRSARDLGMDVVYDVAHNIAKIEEHMVDGQPRRVCVHRKGATRAFPPGHPDLPRKYLDVGQPVLIPGDMGRASFVAVGTVGAMEQSFGSTCHGAGRALSRSAARRRLRGVNMIDRLGAMGVAVRARNPRLLSEEAPDAYKNVADVTAITHGAGISRNVARLRPLGVIKG